MQGLRSTNHKDQEQELIFNTVAGDYTEWSSAPIDHAGTTDSLGEPRPSAVPMLALACTILETKIKTNKILMQFEIGSYI